MSASLTTIVLTLGMSIPFSMIVVRRKRHFAVDEARHHRLEFVLGHLPVADRDPGARDELLEGAGDAVDRLDAVVDVVDWPPRSSSVAIARWTTASDCGTTTVLIDMRFFGAVWISERSRTPMSDICRVRGIGVAESVSTSTVARSC